MSNNMFKLNEEKTELIVFAPRSRITNLSETSLLFHKNIIHRVQSVRNLGNVVFGAKQCNAVLRTCYSQIRKIGRIRHFLQDSACKTLVHSLVTSRLDYGNALLYNVNSTYIMKLQRVQNTAARLITRTGKHEHIQPTLFDLHQLPVMYRVQYKLCVYVYKALHNLAPMYLAELVCEHKPARSLRSESANQLVVPRVRAKTYSDRFDKVPPTLWNRLPVGLRIFTSLTVFKAQLKTHLFRKAFLLVYISGKLYVVIAVMKSLKLCVFSN